MRRLVLFFVALFQCAAFAEGSKTVIAFDLDDTLAVTKSPVTPQMAELLVQLLDRYEVCVISGGKFEQFKTQVVDKLTASSTQLDHLHLMPTSGTQYYRFNTAKQDWYTVYSEELSAEQKQHIVSVAKAAAQEAGLWPENPYGQVIEDRGSQISMSMLGLKAPPDKKYEWAKLNSEKRAALRDVIASRLVEFEVRAGGTTTIDITRKGIDKAYGMAQLMERLSLLKTNILFVGDKMEPGGNDYPVKAFGIDSIAVKNHEDTALLLEGIISVSPKR
jgi:phosphomannomutase